MACAALALALGACGKDDESETGASRRQRRHRHDEPHARGRNEHPERGAESDDIVSVRIKDITFVPAAITAKVGQTITWTNDEPAPHNVTAEQGADFKSETLNKGDTFDYTPKQAGTIDYVCTIHPGQDGRLIVTK